MFATQFWARRFPETYGQEVAGARAPETSGKQVVSLQLRIGG